MYAGHDFLFTELVWKSFTSLFDFIAKFIKFIKFIAKFRRLSDPFSEYPKP